MAFWFLFVFVLCIRVNNILMGTEAVELSFAFQSLRALKALWALMTREFWRSTFLALMDKRQPTCFWLVVLLFPWITQVPVVRDHE